MSDVIPNNLLFENLAYVRMEYCCVLKILKESGRELGIKCFSFECLLSSQPSHPVLLTCLSLGLTLRIS